MTTQKTYRLFMVGLFLAVAPALSMESDNKTQAWIDTLQSEASLFEKTRACQQLGEFGTVQAVPALASLLDHEKLSTYARAGLERIPGPEASAALRQAMGQLQGTRQIGVIHSLAALRDEKAVRALSTLVQDSDPEVGKAALLALGRIANEPAIQRVVQALTSGPEDARAHAAAACLLGAGHQLKQGNAKRASAIYEKILQSRVPLSYHIGATRGAILSQAGDTSFLVQQLRSERPAIRNVGLLTIRQNPSKAFATALNAEIDRSPRDLQVLLIDALKDCHNAQSFSVLWAKVAADDALVRMAALKVLQAIGRPDSVPALINALQNNRDKETLSMAVSILERLEGTQVDAQILKALSSAKASQVRIALMGLLGKRSVTGAADELLRQAADPDTKVSIAAYQALKSLAGTDALPRLIELTKECRDQSARNAAALAVYSVCRNGEDGDQSARLVLKALRTTTVATEKMAWIRVLALLGYSDALPTITATLQDANQALVQSTISHLGRWPDPAPIDDLFQVVEGDARAAVRQRALTAVLQLATAAADRNQATDEDLVRWFKRAGKAAQSTQEKRLLISGLGRVKHIESVQLLASYLDDSNVKMEAINAILNAAAPLVKGSDYATVEIVLNRMPNLKDPRLVRKIADMQRDIKATAAKLKK